METVIEKQEEEEEGAEGEEQKEQEPKEPVEDPNKDRFTPHFIHLDKTSPDLLTISDQLSYTEYIGTLLNDQKFGLIFDDAYYENLSGDLVRLYYGMGVGYFNVKGVQHQEKTVKAQEYT